MANYDVKERLDLTAALDEFQIVAPQKDVYSVVVTRMAPGTTLYIKLGQSSGKLIPVSNQGFAIYDPRGCAIENDGVFVTAPAQPGVTVDIFLGFQPIVSGKVG